MNATHALLIISLLLGIYGAAMAVRGFKMRDRLRFLEEHGQKMTDYVKDLRNEISAYETLVARPDIRTLFMTEKAGCISVFAANSFSTKKVCIKEFPYDEDDIEDKDFALREAMELIEKLKEK